MSSARLLPRHVLPNSMVATLTYLPFILNGSITTLTALDFLGFGLPPGSPSLGELLKQGKDNLQAPWLGITGFIIISVMLTLLVFVGEAVRDSKKIEHATRDLAAITGQKPVVTRAKRANAAFKLRAGMPIGCKVTLRDERMYEFLDRLINIAIPRIRDFRGISPKQFDGRGNFAMGVTEQIIFPEIDYDQIDKLRGMDITISTTAANDEQGRALLAAFNFPFRS